MELLLVPVVLIGLLVLGTHLLGASIALRELPAAWRHTREQYRALSRRQRAFSVTAFLLSVVAGLALVWAIETPSTWSTAGWVLLAVFGGFAVVLVGLTPWLVWREYRRKETPCGRGGGDTPSRGRLSRGH